jgi:VIT1/CCC1 family predicted Fe2+/Mn2+ transporter
MALGARLSVQSSRELYRRQIAIEAREAAAIPDEETEELVLISQAKGLAKAQARALGLAPDAQPRQCAGYSGTRGAGRLGLGSRGLSFVLFAIGAIIPVVPFPLIARAQGWVLGLRQVVLGLLAAAITFGVGPLVRCGAEPAPPPNGAGRCSGLPRCSDPCDLVEGDQHRAPRPAGWHGQA